MTPIELANIPSVLLAEDGTERLRAWLDEHGFEMTLTELAHERRRRQIRIYPVSSGRPGH